MKKLLRGQVKITGLKIKTWGARKLSVWWNGRMGARIESELLHFALGAEAA
jgi:hypothetical protein